MNTVLAGSTVSPLGPARTFGVARALFAGIRVAAAVALWMGLGALTGVAALIAAPKFFGGQALTVMSGSMRPAIQPGDIVLTEPIAPLDARVGDIVTFRSHERGNRLLTHRVREITVKGNQVSFVTKGDAVNASENWSVSADAKLARPKFRLRKLGYPLFWLNHPFGRVALYVLPVLLIGGVVLFSIWRPAPTTEATGPARSTHRREPSAPAVAPAPAGEASRSLRATDELLRASGSIVILTALGLAVFTVRRFGRATGVDVR